MYGIALYKNVNFKKSNDLTQNLGSQLFDWG